MVPPVVQTRQNWNSASAWLVLQSSKCITKNKLERARVCFSFYPPDTLGWRDRPEPAHGIRHPTAYGWANKFCLHCWIYCNHVFRFRCGSMRWCGFERLNWFGWKLHSLRVRIGKVNGDRVLCKSKGIVAELQVNDWWINLNRTRSHGSKCWRKFPNTVAKAKRTFFILRFSCRQMATPLQYSVKFPNNLFF